MWLRSDGLPSPHASSHHHLPLTPRPGHLSTTTTKSQPMGRYSQGSLPAWEIMQDRVTMTTPCGPKKQQQSLTILNVDVGLNQLHFGL